MLSGWKKRGIIPITGSIDGSKTNYPIKINLNYIVGMKSDFADIRFATTDDNLLNHWMESYLVGASAVFWVEIPSLPVSPAQTEIYVYFSNSSASTASDIEMFSFADDFDDASIDLAKWDVKEGVNSEVSESDGKLSIYHNGSSQSNRIVGKTVETGVDVAVRARVNFGYQTAYTGAYRRNIGWGLESADGARLYITDAGGGSLDSVWRIENTSEVDTPTTEPISPDQYYVIEIKNLATKTLCYINDTLDHTEIAQSLPDGLSKVAVFQSVNTSTREFTSWLDFILIRPTIENEPTVGEIQDIISLSVGRSHVFAYQNDVTIWGSAIAPSAGDRVLLKSINPLFENVEYIPDWSCGFAWHEYIYKGKKLVEPEIEMPLRWSGREWSFIAQLMGSESVTGVGPYTHAFDLADGIDGTDLYGTLVALFGIETTQLLLEWPSFKPIKFVLTTDKDNRLNLSVNGIANKINTIANSTTVVSDMSDVDHLEIDSALPKIIPFTGGRYRINDFSDGALGSDDILKITNFTLKFGRNASQEFDTNGSTDGIETSEPIDSGIADQLLTLEMPNDSYDQLVKYQGQSTRKADLYWAYSDDHDLLIEFPCLYHDKPGIAVTKQDRVKTTLQLIPVKCPAAPTGMTRTNWGITFRDDYSGGYV